MWTYSYMVGNFILYIPGNMQESLFRPTRELTEDIVSLLSLPYTATTTGVNEDSTQNAKDNYDVDAMMANINDSQ